MKFLTNMLLTGLLCCPLPKTQAQGLPVFSVDRRMDRVYMDSLSGLARRQYALASRQPATAPTDTVRFQTLYYLGRLYSWWEGRQDSSRYFADLLTRQARLHRNVAFEVKGILINEFYYRDLRVNYPEALRLNYQARAILQKAKQDPMLNWRIDLNLGELYSISGDQENALRFLSSARRRIARGSGVGPQATIGYLADIEQKIGVLYEEQGSYAESEKHYLAAEAVLANGGSKTNFGYIYEVLSALYLTTGNYSKALDYARKAEPLWESMNEPYSITNNWSILAVGYAGTGQHELASQYARKVLNRKNAVLAARQRAYLALYKLAENQQDWQQSLVYYRTYVALSDTIRNTYQAQKMASYQRKSELELLALQHEQARKLETEQLRTLQNKTELTQLRAVAQTDSLTKKSLIAEQQRLLDRERAKTELNRQRTRQLLLQQQFEVGTRQQQRSRIWLLSGLAALMAFTTVLGLVYQRNQRQKRQIEQLNAGLEQTVNERTAELLITNDELRRANQAIKDVDARIVQTQETERERMAADLHDDLGGTLATIRRRIADIRFHLSDTRVARQIDDLEPLIQKSSDDLRRIAHNLMPPEFARIGLRHALDHFVRNQPPHPTRFSFIASGLEQKLPLDTELNIYRIVSEMVQNIHRHAVAQQAAVQLLYYTDHLTVTVEDNGLGNRLHKTTDEAMGIGLKNSSLRAEYIGATLWREVSESGTLVVLDVPYPILPDAVRATQPNPADRRPPAV